MLEVCTYKYFIIVSVVWITHCLCAGALITTEVGPCVCALVIKGKEGCVVV